MNFPARGKRWTACESSGVWRREIYKVLSLGSGMSTAALTQFKVRSTGKRWKFSDPAAAKQFIYTTTVIA